MPLAGVLTNWFGSRAVVWAGAVATATLVVVPVVSPVLAGTVAGLLLLGAASGSMDVSMNVQAIAIQEGYGRPIMSSVHAAFSFGGFVGAAVAWALIAAGFGPGAHVLVVSGLTLVLLAAVLPQLLRVPGHGVGGGPAFARPSGPVLVLAVMAFGVMLGEGSMLDWSALYLHEELATSAATAALGFGAFSASMAVARLFGDRMVTVLGPARTTAIGAAIAAAGLAVGLLLATPAAAIAAFMLVGVGLANIVPMVFAAAGSQEGIPAGTGLAAVATLGYVGFLVGPPVIGAVAELTSLAWALGLVAVTLAAVGTLGQRLDS
jgi:hypothetical protein